MTYIKWKDEVESYLGNLSASEKQKVFSYFAEMYADKRDAGMSEEKIIEGFGAPYDVAQRILADSKDSSSSPQGESGQGAVHGSGGNNYNYNYYNYNYGGAPAGFGGQPGANFPPNGAPSERFGQGYGGTNGGDVDVSDIDMPLPDGTPNPAEKKGGNALTAFLLILVLAIPSIVIVSTGVGLTIGFFSASIGCLVSGFMTIGEACGGLVAGLGKSQIGLMGSGLLQVGIGFIFIPLSVLFIKLIWKFIGWIFKQFKALVTA